MSKEETILLLKKTRTGQEFAEVILNHFRTQSYYKVSPFSNSNKKVGDFSMFDGLVPVSNLTLDDISI